MKVSYESSDPLNRSRHSRQHVPVRAELERHHDPRHHTESERHAEYFQPEFEHPPVRRTTRRKIQSLKYGEPRGEADRERWKNDVKRDGEGELKPRQKKSGGVHRSAPSIRPRACRRPNEISPLLQRGRRDDPSDDPWRRRRTPPPLPCVGHDPSIAPRPQPPSPRFVTRR